MFRRWKTLLFLLVAVVPVGLFAGAPNPRHTDPLEVLGITEDPPYLSTIYRAYHAARTNILYREDSEAQTVFRSAMRKLVEKEKEYSKKREPRPLTDRDHQLIATYAETPVHLVESLRSGDRDSTFQRLVKVSARLNDPVERKEFLASMAQKRIFLTPAEWHEIAAHLAPEFLERVDRIGDLAPDGSPGANSPHLGIMAFLAFDPEFNGWPAHAWRAKYQHLLKSSYVRLEPVPSSDDLALRLGLPPWASAEQVAHTYQKLRARPRFGNDPRLLEAAVILGGELRSDYENGRYRFGRPMERDEAQFVHHLISEMLLKAKTPSDLARVAGYYASELADPELKSLLHERRDDLFPQFKDPEKFKAFLQTFLNRNEPPTRLELDLIQNVLGSGELLQMTDWLDKENTARRTFYEKDHRWLRLLALMKGLGIEDKDEWWAPVHENVRDIANVVRQWVNEEGTGFAAARHQQLRDAVHDRDRKEALVTAPSRSDWYRSLWDKLELAGGISGIGGGVVAAYQVHPLAGLALGAATVAGILKSRKGKDKYSFIQPELRRAMVTANERATQIAASNFRLASSFGLEVPPIPSTPPSEQCLRTYRELGLIRFKP